MDRFPTLFTERLKLRKIEVEDVPSLLKYVNNQKITDNITNFPYPYREPDAVFRISYVFQGFKAGSRFVFAITMKEEDELIGEISLHLNEDRKQAELGYWVGEPFWGKGIATEAASAVINFGFEKIGLEKVFATCHINNPGSIKVVEQNGLAKESENGNVGLYVINNQ